MTKKILLALLIVFVIMQFFRIDKTNPPIVAEQDFLQATNAPSDIQELITNACYDCHSHHTEYPWYTNVAPLSWWIKGHINEGRKHLNFSTWTEGSAKKREHKLEECAEEVLALKMPMPSFTYTHSEAKLSEAQVATLVDWFESERSKVN